MEPISSAVLLQKLQQWVGKSIYIHIEISPGGYFRNGKASLQAVHVKGQQSFRVFLELDERRSIIQIDDVTHMSIADELVTVTGYDAHDRLARTLEISMQSFPL